MTLQIQPPHAYTGEVIQPTADSTRCDLAVANDHLHKVIKALLKERSGLPLTPKETRHIGLYVAAQLWQLQHTNKE